jgi:hypothetical protein
MNQNKESHAVSAMGERRYRANMNEASVGTWLAGSIHFGLTNPATENPTATRTLIAVISEAKRKAVVRDERLHMEEESADIEKGSSEIGIR